MRVLPVINKYNSFATKNKINTRFERKDFVFPRIRNHKYTGVASADLAYASMFDNKIARDLKLMGLI